MNDLLEELIVEILVKLDVRPLFRCNCVSKRWHSIISDHKFGQIYMQTARSSPESSSSLNLWGILFPHQSIKRSRKKSTLVDIDIDKSPPSLYHVLRFSRYRIHDFKIFASSNGLILSVPYSLYTEQFDFKLYVSNPLTKKYVQLPRPSVPIYTRLKYGFATRAQGDNPTDVSYKVVCFYDDDSSKCIIITFSSDTESWTYKESIDCPKGVFSSDPFACKGILHWFDWGGRAISTYAPYESPEVFGRIDMPTSIGLNRTLDNTGMNLIHLGHEESLKFGDIECCGENERRLRVWRLVDYDTGEWCLEHKCLITPLWSDGLLRKCRQLVAPDPCNAKLFCWLLHNDDRIWAGAIETGEEVLADNSKVKREEIRYSSEVIDPIGLCPWSSPYCGQSWTTDSSKVEQFRKISSVWFPCFN